MISQPHGFFTTSEDCGFSARDGRGARRGDTSMGSGADVSTVALSTLRNRAVASLAEFMDKGYPGPGDGQPKVHS